MPAKSVGVPFGVCFLRLVVVNRLIGDNVRMKKTLVLLTVFLIGFLSGAVVGTLVYRHFFQQVVGQGGKAPAPSAPEAPKFESAPPVAPADPNAPPAAWVPGSKVGSDYDSGLSLDIKIDAPEVPEAILGPSPPIEEEESEGS